MSEYIDLNEYEDLIDDLDRGETIRVDHAMCPAGTDAKKRLYITKPASSPNVILGYCHNCQNHGILKTDEGRYRDFDTDALAYNDLTTEFAFEPPSQMAYDIDDWPMLAVKWRIQKGLSKNDCINYGLAYDPSSNRIYIPIYQTIERHTCKLRNLIGYQLRDISNQQPKYITAMRSSADIPHTILATRNYIDMSHLSKVAVIVEDMASGIKVLEALYNNNRQGVVLVNYGVAPKVEPLHHMIEVYDPAKIVVWLDNDSGHVINQAEQIGKVAKTLSTPFTKVDVFDKEEGDPKQYDWNNIISVIDTGELRNG